MKKIILLGFFLGFIGSTLLAPRAIRAAAVVIEAPDAADYGNRIDVVVRNCRDNTNRCEVSIWQDDQKLKRLYCDSNHCRFSGADGFSIPVRGSRLATISVINNEGDVLAEKDIEITGIPGGFQPEPCDTMGTRGIQTALGCIPTVDATKFIAWILKFAIGIGGGIAFILMLIGVFQIITSSGDPERLKAGKELITSALIGLLMIIFSLFLLQLIGVQILQIPGF